MRDCGGGDINPYCCHLHPKEVMVGVCALCLKEKLLVLASKQPQEGTPMRKPSIKLGTVFAVSSFLQRLEINRQGHERSRDAADVDSIDEICEASIASLEDSFISIKLEENEHASWHGKKTINTIPYTSITCGSAALGKGKRSASTVENGQREGGGGLRWRSRISQLLQLAQWKSRSSKASSGNGGRFRGRRSSSSAWMIKSLTRRRRQRRRWATADQ